MFVSLFVAWWMACLATGVSGFSGLVPISFIQEPSYTVAYKNKPVTLKCRVDGKPPPSSFTWEKDGQEIILDSRRRIQSNGALHITRIIHTRESKPDVGEYQCFASNVRGRIASRKVRLDVAGMSKKFHKEPQNTITWVGSIARFSCQIQHAVPVATLVWEKDGSPLEPSDRSVILKEGVLQIKDVRKTDEGNYSCVAENVVKTRRSNLGSLAVLTVAVNERFLLAHEWSFCIPPQTQTKESWQLLQQIDFQFPSLAEDSNFESKSEKNGAFGTIFNHCRSSMSISLNITQTLI